MYNFPQLLKAIRKETHLTQAGLANKLEVSAILIAMIESGQKEPSKKFVVILARKMRVSPNAITPFIFDIDDDELKKSKLEKKLIEFGAELQRELIKRKAKNILDATK